MSAEQDLHAILDRLENHLPTYALIVRDPDSSWIAENVDLFPTRYQTGSDEDTQRRARLALAGARLEGAPEEEITTLLRCVFLEASPSTAPRPITRERAIEALNQILEASLHFGYRWPYPDFGSLLDAIGSDGLWLVETFGSRTYSGEAYEAILLGHNRSRVALFLLAATTA
jgi:hypothetical protein